MGRFIALSALLHAALLWISFSPEEQKPAPLQYLVTVPAPAKKATGKTKGRGGGGDLTLGDLGIGKGGFASLSDGVSSGNGSSLNGTPLEFVSKTVIHDYLHRRLNAAIDYPQALVDEGIGGEVKARLVFSAEGVWIRGRSQITSASRYLRVHMIQILRGLFKKPLPRNYLRGEELSVECHFLFEVARQENFLDALERDLPGNPAKKGFVGNHLSIYRSGKRLGEWKLGPVAGYALVPAIAIDPLWFVKQFEEKPDPMRKYREDPEF